MPEIPECFIRPYQRGDGLAFYEAAMESVHKVGLWMPWCHPGFTLDEANTWVEQKVQSYTERSEYEFVVVDPAGAFLGACGANQIDLANRRGNVGYWVRSSAMNRGYATAAIQLLSGWVEENTNLERLELIIAVENAASIRVAEKIEAFREGVLRNRLPLHGVFHDAVMFSLIRGQNMAGYFPRQHLR